MNLGQELKQLAPPMDTAGLAAGVYRKRARRRRFMGAGMAVLGLALIVPLSTFFPSPLPENQPAGDWVAYSSLDEMLQAADVVVLARATGERSVDMAEPTPPDDPNDPEQNPHLGVTNAPEPEPYAVELDHLVVQDSVLGDLPPGSEIRVGVIEGPYPVDLEAGSSYAMFLAEGGEGRYHLLNPEALYILEDDGLRHVIPTEGAVITIEEIEELFEV